MKQILILLATLLTTAPLLAQFSPCYESAFADGKKQYNAGNYQMAKKYFNEAKECPDANQKVVQKWIEKCEGKHLYRAKKGDKFGFVDWSCNMIIDPQFDDVSNFNEGMARVKQGDLYGYINDKGEMIVTPQYSKAYNYEDGVAHVWTDENEAYIDKRGKVIIDCQQNKLIGKASDRMFEWIGNVHEGIAIVKGKNKLYGCVDLDGNDCVAAQWETCAGFQEGYAKVRTDKKYGHIDRSGKVVDSCRWADVKNYSEGLAPVKDDKGKWGFVNYHGRLVIPCIWDQVEYFKDGLAEVTMINGNTNSKQKGVIDNKGNYVIEPGQFEDFKNIKNINEGCVVVRTKQKYGVVDKTGSMTAVTRFKDIGVFYGGLAKAKDEKGSWGYIDCQGNWAVMPVYDFVGNFYDGVAEVRVKGIFCLIDTHGQLIYIDN